MIIIIARLPSNSFTCMHTTHCLQWRKDRCAVVLHPNPKAGKTGSTMSSLERGLGILIAIADQGEVSAASLSEKLQVPRSTIYRHLQVLCKYDLVEDDDGRYIPGWRAVGMSGRNLTHTILSSLAFDVLVEVSEALNETAVIAVRAGTHAVCLRQMRGHHPDHISFKLNQLLPLHAGAGQKILLAFSSSGLIRSILSNNPEMPGNDPINSKTFRDELEKARNKGYIESRGDLYQGSLAIAVPVIVNGETICSLTVAGQQTRCDTKEWRSRALRILRKNSDYLSEQIREADDKLRYSSL